MMNKTNYLFSKSVKCVNMHRALTVLMAIIHQVSRRAKFNSVRTQFSLVGLQVIMATYVVAEQRRGTV